MAASRHRIVRLAGVVASFVTFGFGVSGCGGASPTSSDSLPADTGRNLRTVNYAAGNGQTERKTYACRSVKFGELFQRQRLPFALRSPFLMGAGEMEHEVSAIIRMTPNSVCQASRCQSTSTTPSSERE